MWCEFAGLALLISKNHDISMHAGVERVLGLTKVICSIIDAKDFVPVYLVVNNNKRVALCWCEHLLVLVTGTKQSSKDMVFEMR
jgi:hypothetical protein